MLFIVNNGLNYLFDSAFPLTQTFFNPTLPLSNIKGSEARIPSAINARRSVVNLATPHSDDAIAIIDNCIQVKIKKKYYQIIHCQFVYLLKIIVSLI